MKGFLLGLCTGLVLLIISLLPDHNTTPRTWRMMSVDGVTWVSCDNLDEIPKQRYFWFYEEKTGHAKMYKDGKLLDLNKSNQNY